MASTLTHQNSSAAERTAVDSPVLCLGVIWHPEFERIGEVARLNFDKTGCAELSRLVPAFEHPGEGSPNPLLDRHISRTPISIFRMGRQSFRFSSPKQSTRLTVNGRPITDDTTVQMDELGEDIIISIADTVVLSLFYTSTALFGSSPKDDLGFLGISRGMTDIRTAIPQMAIAEAAILVRGETGTGKELIAKALHHAGTGASRKLVTVNMATLSSELAPAELFGAKKGAFTGSTQDKIGLFEQAHEGVLFLDEIGDTPSDVQPMLLRALELGEIRPVGDTKVRKVRTRIIAATDRNLDAANGNASFNQPLLQRLSGFTIDIPRLRERRIDIGLLLRSMLKTDSQTLKDLSAKTVLELSLYDWPGNVRELQNIARSLELGQPLQLKHRSVESTSVITDRAAENKTAEQRQYPAQYRHAHEVDDDALLRALNETDWIIKEAAQKLGVSRTALYGLMEKSTIVRRIEDISTDELKAVIASIPGGTASWAKHLCVGKASLERKIRQISTSGLDQQA